MAKIVFDDDKECEISKETEQRLRKLLLQSDLYEKIIAGTVRVSVIGDKFGESWYPIRLSILGDCKQGTPRGSFNNLTSSWGDGLPGYTMMLHDARLLRDALNECIEFVEKK